MPFLTVALKAIDIIPFRSHTLDFCLIYQLKNVACSAIGVRNQLGIAAVSYVSPGRSSCWTSFPPHLKNKMATASISSRKIVILGAGFLGMNIVL